MSTSKKRRVEGVHHENTDISQLTCILHSSNVQHGEFISLQNIRSCPKEKLKFLHEIRLQRINQPPDSPARLENVCSLIPLNLDELDLKTTGYHRGCYQNFTNHLDRLKGVVLDIPPVIRSPRKSSSSTIFPSTCIFCEKLETKFRGKTERCVKFGSFKQKDASWAHIESYALEMGDTRLHRKVVGQDLFAKEACFHKSCFNSFKLKHSYFSSCIHYCLTYELVIVLLQ